MEQLEKEKAAFENELEESKELMDMPYRTLKIGYKPSNKL